MRTGSGNRNEAITGRRRKLPFLPIRSMSVESDGVQMVILEIPGARPQHSEMRPVVDDRMSRK